MEGKIQSFVTLMVQYYLHSLLSMELEMEMQLLLLIWYQRKRKQVRMPEDLFTLVHFKCFCTEFKIKLLTTDTAVIHMATPTMTPIYYTNQTQEIPSTLSEKWLYSYYMHKWTLFIACVKLEYIID